MLKIKIKATGQIIEVKDFSRIIGTDRISSKAANRI